MPKKGAVRGRVSPYIRHLVATGPFKPLKDKLRLFGQFVGDWDIVEARSLQEDGSWKTSKGEFHAGWILGGTAIQDTWKSVGRGVDDMGGTTIYLYDREARTWSSIWISPDQAIVRGFTGGKKGKEIILESRETKKRLMRWIFYDIKKNSFRWKAKWTVDGGKKWIVTEEMSIKRKSTKKDT